MAAIKQHFEKERKGYLDSQVEDLTSASNTLEDAIRRIDKETRDRLIATFNEVRDPLNKIHMITNKFYFKM